MTDVNVGGIIILRLRYVRVMREKGMENQIEQLKRVKTAVILAHYYAPAEVQEIADYVGGLILSCKDRKAIRCRYTCILRCSVYGGECEDPKPRQEGADA